MAAAGAVGGRRPCAPSPIRAGQGTPPPISTGSPPRSWPHGGDRLAVPRLPPAAGRRRPFPAVLCASVNDAVVHGVPRRRRRWRDGDLVLGGLRRHPATAGADDAARSFVIGTPRDAPAAALIAATDCARWPRASPRCGRATRSATSATRSRRWPAAPGTACSPTTAGTASARTMHEAPHVPNSRRPGEAHGAAARPGARDRADADRRTAPRRYVHDPDGWTLRSATGAPRAAHSEHTVGRHHATAPAS